MFVAVDDDAFLELVRTNESGEAMSEDGFACDGGEYFVVAVHSIGRSGGE